MGRRPVAASNDLFILPESALASTRVKLRGHAAQPGTGPEGETCGSCALLVRKQAARVYLKCGHPSVRQTNGPGTDVRARDPACQHWLDRN